MADLLAEYIDARVERLSPPIAAIADPLVVIEATMTDAATHKPNRKSLHDQPVAYLLAAI